MNKNDDSEFLTKTNLYLILAGIAYGGLLAFGGNGLSIEIKIALSLIGTTILGVVGSSLHLIRQLLKEVRFWKAANLTSNEDEISKFRKLYHFYWKTRDYKGVATWRYAKYDFCLDRKAGHLTAISIEISPKMKEIKYKMTAIVRGDRLILLKEILEGNEKPTIAIFQDFASGYSTAPHCGIYSIETYATTDKLSCVIMSDEVVENWNKVGAVDARTSAKLSELWKTEMDGRLDLDMQVM